MGESKLDKHRKEILDLLEMGVTKSRVAKDLGVNQSSLRYWLDSRGLQATSTNHPLHGDCVQIISDAIGQTRDGLYSQLARAIEDLEHKGVWLGNGHHAAQNIVTKVMEQMEPVLSNAIRREMLR